MRTRKFTALCLVILLNVSAVLACSFPFADSGNETDESGTTATVTQAAPTATETEFDIET
ncbi:MAG: hypothetical protein P8Y98_02555 [Anaerolineales bacterium]